MSLVSRIRAWLGMEGDPSPASSVRTCKRGHRVSDRNAYVRPDGRGTECRACRRKASERARMTTTNQPVTGHSQEG
jgi:hypothetical protein